MSKEIPIEKLLVKKFILKYGIVYYMAGFFELIGLLLSIQFYYDKTTLKLQN